MDPIARTLEHERIANESKHWVRLVAACNSRCLFCLDSEAQDGKILAFDDVCREIRRGREEKDATRVVLSGGEASLHPRFAELIQYSREQGYTWVQTVTNGRRYADRAYFNKVVEAGLSEITFSIHGHTAALHDHLTQAPGSFDQIVKAMIRAVRDGRVVVNADVVINKQNVDYLEKIVALCAQIGVREYDLLHVIPQGEAWEHREQLFYDVDAYSESLRRVFRLGLNPRFHVWTNRFPVSHLEGMEELIQDPHKMLDEVGGRRMQFRRYLDAAEPIDCRHTERCPHCFIEPFCSALDRRVQQLRDGELGIWWIGDRYELAALHPEATLLGVTLPAGAALPEFGRPVYLKAEDFTRLTLPKNSVAVATTAAHLEQLEGLPCEVEIPLDRSMCAALLADPERLRRNVDRYILHGKTWIRMEESAEKSPDYLAFFTALPLPMRTRNLPACLCPDMRLEQAPRRLDQHILHDDGRLAIDPIVEEYIESEYKAKSQRCKGCVVADRCEGMQLQYLRHAGFRVLQPLSGAWADRAAAVLRQLQPQPRRGLAQGAPPQSPVAQVPVPGNRPVPEIDVVPGRRS